MATRNFTKNDNQSLGVERDAEKFEGGDGFDFETLEGRRSMEQAQSISVSQGSGEKRKRSSLHLQVINVFANSFNIVAP